MIFGVPERRPGGWDSNSNTTGTTRHRYNNYSVHPNKYALPVWNSTVKLRIGSGHSQSKGVLLHHILSRYYSERHTYVLLNWVP